jgi:hypothetical protein
MASMALIYVVLTIGVLLFVYAPRFSTITTATTANENQASSLSQIVPLWTLISTIASRADAVLILLFLVQILVSLYRYNFRLASYYDGGAYALELMNNADEKSFQALVGAMSPEILDFGKMPKTPTEHAIVLAEKIVQAARTKGGD